MAGGLRLHAVRPDAHNARGHRAREALRKWVELWVRSLNGLNPYGENSGSSRAGGNSRARLPKLRVVSGCGRAGDRGRGILHPTAFSAASVGRSAGLDCVDVLTPLRLPLGRVERSLDFDEKLIVVGDAGCYRSGLDRLASLADMPLP